MNQPTRVACLTPSGAAAVATIAIVGPRAWELVRSELRAATAKGLPDQPDTSRHWIGEFGPPPGDTVVVTVRRAGATPWIEVHCHGGEHNTRTLINALHSRGAVAADAEELAGEFESTPLRAAAARELMHAATARTAAILLDQHQGALDDSLTAIHRDLQAGRNDLVSGRIAALDRYSMLGRRLVTPWRVAVTGPPNAGKSSLVNRIVGFERCIVASSPGTTRDAVSVLIAIDGWPVELIDTAGQRPTYDLLEKSGMELAREATARADLTLWLHDATTPFEPPPADAFLVWNKIDIGSALAPAGAHSISARTGEGVDDLLRFLGRRLVPDAPPPGAAVPFSPTIADSIAAIANLIQAGSVDEAREAIERLTAANVPCKDHLLPGAGSHTFGKRDTGA